MIRAQTVRIHAWHTSEETELTEDGIRVGPEEVGVLMDLLSHDMLNNNQATLSYLELIHSSPGADPRIKELAEKATSQVRTSSVLLDGIRQLSSYCEGTPAQTTPVDLRGTLAQVTRDVSGLFPHKQVTIDTTGLAPNAEVHGGQYVHDIFGHVLMNIVQLDPEDHSKIDVSSVREKHNGSDVWKIEVVSRTATLPQGVDDSLFSGTVPMDVSKMARVSGAVFASSIARAIGGRIGYRVLDPEKNRGCVFEISLKGGDAR